jgi:hypothetical protein
VGATLAIVILITFFAGVYLWSGQVEQEMDEFDIYRKEEDLVVFATFNYTGEEYNVSISTENTGTADIELVRVWIIDENNNDHQFLNISYFLPQRTTEFLSTSEIGKLLEKLDNTFDLTSSTYYVKILTAKGNLFSTTLIPLALYQNVYSSAIITESSYIYFESSSNSSEGYLEVWNGLENMTIETILVSGIINVTNVMNYTINENITLPIDDEAFVEEIILPDNTVLNDITIPINVTITIPVEFNVTETQEITIFQSDKISADNSTILSNLISAIIWEVTMSEVIRQNVDGMIHIELIDSSGQIVTAGYLRVQLSEE